MCVYLTDGFLHVEDKDQVDFVSAVALYNLAVSYCVRVQHVEEANFSSSSSQFASRRTMLEGSSHLLSLSLQVIDTLIEANLDSEGCDECQLLAFLYIRFLILSKLSVVYSKLPQFENFVSRCQENLMSTFQEARSIVQDPSSIICNYESFEAAPAA
jgi:hypothetical protein